MSGRRKPVQCWVVVKDYGTWNSIRSGDHATKKAALASHPLADKGYPVVHLVESSPAEARRKREERAVVRAALKFEAGPGESTGEGMGHLRALRAAVARLKRGGA